ncbi:MAG: hypothetical protein ACJAQ4_000150 [Cryomorphaceae bacterium]
MQIPEVSEEFSIKNVQLKIKNTAASSAVLKEEGWCTEMLLQASGFNVQLRTECSELID